MDRVPSHIHDAPLRAAASAHRRAVVFHAPDGRVFALTPEAVEQSLAGMAEAARLAGANGACRGTVLFRHFPAFRPVARLRQRMMLGAGQGSSQRRLVALLLVPIVFVVLAGSGAIALLAWLDGKSPALWWLLLPLFALGAALPIAWRIAPHLMACDESRPQQRRAQLRLV
ncbi:hypothetical protein [Novosphingobium sp. TH158]|uniref:hypothetical protein n=1 Tax=Novosphingobium sp. TH158 TaxID=2067455 RepID=UPI000C7BCC76|nr:hypothetical protein [Novosphingobium sp. TH158]PLK24319.1 hypothetical protein C0V78_13720 [Novosphingobium sp. TH158]